MASLNIPMGVNPMRGKTPLFYTTYVGSTYLVRLEWREVLHKLFYKDLEFGKLQYAHLQY